jgi:hypothetical protein
MIWFIKGNLYYITGIYSALQGIKLRYRKTDFITGTQGGGCRPPIDLIVDFHIIPPLSLKRIINDKNNPSIDIFYFISSYRVLLIFEHIGGVPTAIWFDNMSTVVKRIKEYGERDLTKGFLRFMMHYGFRSNFCNPDSGHEKGSVENKVGYHRRNMLVPIPEFKDLREYNKELLLKCDKDMNRMHYKGYGMIKDLFQEDKQELFNLPKVPFEVYLHEFAKADNYGKIKFDGRIYSTSPNMARQQVIVKAGAYDVEILDEDCNHIIKHRRLYGEEKESMNWIPYLELMSKRPTALKYTGLYNQLPQILKDYLDKSDYEGKKRALKLFAKMTASTGINSAIEAFEEGLKLGVSDADSIWATYCRLTSGTLPEPEVSLPDTVPELKKYSPDIKIYDQLIVPGGLQL